jgi:hypothetical protein
MMSVLRRSHLIPIVSCVVFGLVACGTQTSGSVTTVPDTSGPVSSEGPPALLVELSKQSATNSELTRTSYERWAGDVAAHQAAAVIRAFGDNGDQD